MGTIKAFEQLTDKELLELTDEQIDWYVKLKKAENGVRILVEPIVPEYQSVPETDMTLYCVSGHCFLDQNVAMEIAKAINAHVVDSFRVDYDYYGSGSEYKYGKHDDTRMEDVEVKRVYQKATYDSINSVLVSNKKIKERYEALLSEYNQENDKSKELIDRIYTTISSARERVEQFSQYKIRIVEYLRLSNGDVDVAWNFFDKAYAIDPQVKSKIMESEEYQEAIKSY